MRGSESGIACSWPCLGYSLVLQCIKNSYHNENKCRFSVYCTALAVIILSISQWFFFISAKSHKKTSHNSLHNQRKKGPTGPSDKVQQRPGKTPRLVLVLQRAVICLGLHYIAICNYMWIKHSCCSYHAQIWLTQSFQTLHSLPARDVFLHEQ